MRGLWLTGLLVTLVLAACVAAEPMGSAAAGGAPATSAMPSATAAEAIPKAVATALPPEHDPAAPSAAPPVDPTPTPTPAAAGPMPTPRAEPPPRHEPLPTPEPTAELLIGDERVMAPDAMRIPAGADRLDTTVQVLTAGLDQSRCTLTQIFTPDRPELDSTTVTLEPESSQAVSLRDGWHRFQLACPSSAGIVRAERLIGAIDGLPERCRGFEFVDAPPSAVTFDELDSGMVGSWEGCVGTPWLPSYWVDVTFRPDGTYSAASPEVLDGREIIAMYYGTDGDRPKKRWALNGVQPSGLGVGQIDIAWEGHDDINRGDLRNIELMGDQLRFEFFHRGEYGPLIFELHGTNR